MSENTEDEIINIQGLYGYSAHYGWVRIRALYPTTDVDSTWVGVDLPDGSITSFPIDRVTRFTHIAPEWTKEREAQS